MERIHVQFIRQEGEKLRVMAYGLLPPSCLPRPGDYINAEWSASLSSGTVVKRVNWGYTFADGGVIGTVVQVEVE